MKPLKYSKVSEIEKDILTPYCTLSLLFGILAQFQVSVLKTLFCPDAELTSDGNIGQLCYDALQELFPTTDGKTLVLTSKVWKLSPPQSRCLQ